MSVRITVILADARAAIFCMNALMLDRLLLLLLLGEEAGKGRPAKGAEAVVIDMLHFHHQDLGTLAEAKVPLDLEARAVELLPGDTLVEHRVLW